MRRRKKPKEKKERKKEKKPDLPIFRGKFGAWRSVRQPTKQPNKQTDPDFFPCFGGRWNRRGNFSGMVFGWRENERKKGRGNRGEGEGFETLDCESLFWLSFLDFGVNFFCCFCFFLREMKEKQRKWSNFWGGNRPMMCDPSDTTTHNRVIFCAYLALRLTNNQLVTSSKSLHFTLVMVFILWN